jgi:hypothetical protein
MNQIAPEYLIGAISTFYKIRGDIRKKRLITAVNDTSDKLKKFCDRKFFPVWLRCCLHSYKDFLLYVHFEA